MDGKVVAITSASSGIGAAAARLLADKGAAVSIGARRTDRLDALASEIRQRGGRALTCRLDVTQRLDVEKFVDDTVREFGRMDVLVSNAGLARISPMSALDLDGWTSMIDVNLRGVLHGIAAALPVFHRQGEGHLVTTVSTSGLKIVPTQAAYAATKNAVRTALEALRQESTDGTVRTTSISPGYVRTEIADHIDDEQVREQARLNAERVAIPAESVAAAIAFAIDQPHDVEIGDITIRPTVQS
ncbi:SDR family oxidoreductase [Jatrophihabitans fulvus]